MFAEDMYPEKMKKPKYMCSKQCFCKCTFTEDDEHLSTVVIYTANRMSYKIRCVMCPIDREINGVCEILEIRDHKTETYEV